MLQLVEITLTPRKLIQSSYQIFLKNSMFASQSLKAKQVKTNDAERAPKNEIHLSYKSL
jgi:hypothetical protein|tara:strand:+ start:81502 stop:81678 length:177 start_codon:yes stop_codon:yes gene_type:complete